MLMRRTEVAVIALCEERLLKRQQHTEVPFRVLLVAVICIAVLWRYALCYTALTQDQPIQSISMAPEKGYCMLLPLLHGFSD